MDFDLNGTAPGEAEIAAERQRLGAELEQLDQLERRFTWWCWRAAVLLIIVGSAAVWALWSAGAISGQDAVAVFAGTVAGAWAGAQFAGVVLAGAGAGVGGAVAVVGAVAGAGVVAGAGAVFGAVFGAMAVADAAAHWHEARITSPRTSANLSLQALEPLSGAQCVPVVTWCQADPVLAGYQAQVAEQGRMLVAGEFEAMVAWVEGEEARQTAAEREAEEQAACAALQQPVATT